VTVEVFGIGDAPRLEEALAIRMRVFVEEQGVPPELEVDEHDHSDLASRHALVRADGVPVAAGRYYVLEPGGVQIGRMAVLPEWRGRGVGARLLAALAAEAEREGYGRAHLHAQTHAAEFYRKAGFFDDGATLWDAGILHQPMSRTLGRS
jgi:predicted GNAT family N-acyltransferase